MPELVFPQKKPTIIKPAELLLNKGLIWIVFFYFLFFLNEEFVNRWGVTAVLTTALIISGLILLVPLLIVQWAKSDRVQNQRVPTLHIGADRVVFHGHSKSHLVKFDEIKRVTVNRNLDGELKSIVLSKGVFDALGCQNFADMPGIYAALKERLPTAIPWFDPDLKLGRWLVKPYQVVLLFFVTGWLFAWLFNIDFSSGINTGIILIGIIFSTLLMLSQRQMASRGAKGALIFGAVLLSGFFLYAMGDIPRVINHPCGLVHRWQSGCLKAYPDSENLLFLPDGQLARLSSKSIVIEPVDGHRFINLFRATRLQNGRYASNLSFSADGRTAVAGNWGSGILVWDVPTQSVTTQNIPDTSSMVLSPDGKLLGPSGARGTITVWDTTTWEPVFILETEKHGETALGSTLLAVDMDVDQAVHFYDVRSGEETAVFSIDWTDERDYVQVLAFSEDEQMLALVPSQDVMAVLRRDGADWQEIHRVQLPPSSRTDVVAFSADNSLLAVSQINYNEPDGRAEIFIFSLADMRLLQTLETGTGQNYYDLGNVEVMVFSPDKSMLAVSSFREGAVFKLALAE